MTGGTSPRQHVEVEVDWPEYGYVFGTGERIRLADVEARFPVEPDDEAHDRTNVFYWALDRDGHPYRVWLWRNAAIWDEPEPEGT